MIRKFMPTMERVSTVLREQREALGLSSAQIAEKADVPLDFVLDLEAGVPRYGPTDMLNVFKAIEVQALAIPSLPHPDKIKHW